jgi:hypothetical protein
LRLCGTFVPNFLSGFFPESGNPSISRGSSAGREFKKLPVFREA